MFEEINNMFEEIAEMNKGVIDTATLNDYSWLVFGKLTVSIEKNNSLITFQDEDALTVYFYNHKDDIVEEIIIDHLECTILIKLKDDDNETDCRRSFI